MGETQSPPKRLRSRQCMFVLYPESQETSIKYAQENFPCAWALHDKDVHTEKAYQAYAQVMDNFSKTCAAIILLLSLAAGAVALDAKAEDYTPDEAAQEEQEQAPSIDTSGYVQVADPALYAKLDTLQESIDRLADALTPADAETDAEAPTEEQPAPDYTAQLSGISAQLADMAQQATAETAEDADPFQKPFEEYTTGETF